MKPTNQLRYGLFLNGPHLQAWEVECLKELEALSPAPELCFILYRQDMPEYSAEHSSWWKRFQKIGSSKVLYYYFLKYFFRSQAQKPVDCTERFKNIPSLTVAPIKKEKGSEHFPEEALTALKSAQPDFMLRFGFNILGGEILDIPKHGVWSFHHDDEMKYRGSPPCFWEIYKADPVTGAVLQKLTPRLDGGKILKKGYFKTIDHSYSENLDQVLWETSKWPAYVCKNLDSIVPVLTNSTAPIVRIPKNSETLVFALKLFFNQIKNRFQHWFLSEKWNIGIIAKPIQDSLKSNFLTNILDLNLSSWQKFYADPFGVKTGDSFQILAEKFDYRSFQGSLVSLSLKNRKVVEEKITGIDTATHLSYPYLFEENGSYYCIPESLTNNEVCLYKAVQFPNRWEKVATLLNDFQGIDATLIRDNGKYWLFAMDGRNSARMNLYVFYSDSLTGPFSPHALNPVKSDIRSSRPAGTPFFHQNKWYRPAQNCSQTYGGSIVMNEIETLTETEFSEREVSTLNPISGTGFSKGMHTLSPLGNYTLIDGKTHTFIPAVFLKVLKTRFAGAP